MPNAISRWSMIWPIGLPAFAFTVFSSSGLYSAFCTAFRISDGLVVASRGLNCTNCWKSPVSATTVVYCFELVESGCHVES